MTAITWGTAITPGDLTRRVASLVTVDTTVQEDVLAFANTALDVRLFDLGETDPRLKLARIYLALHLATGDAESGAGSGTGAPAGPVTSESCGGMMRSYEALGGANDPLLAESYWGRRYLQLVRAKRYGVLVL